MKAEEFYAELFTNWWTHLYGNWLPGDDQWPRDDPEIRIWAEVKRRVAEHLQPDTIVEIGVRAGYSAFVFLTVSPYAQYVGIDDWAYRDWGGEQAAKEHAHSILADFPNATLLCKDSHDMDLLPILAADLVHVDGDHSKRGCFLDLDLAHRSGAKHILIDDTTGIPEVRSAVFQFLRKRGDLYHFEEIDRNRQGAMLLTRI